MRYVLLSLGIAVMIVGALGVWQNYRFRKIVAPVVRQCVECGEWKAISEKGWRVRYPGVGLGKRPPPRYMCSACYEDWFEVNGERLPVAKGNFTVSGTTSMGWLVGASAATNEGVADALASMETPDDTPLESEN